MKKKRFSSLLICTALVLVLLPATAQAASIPIDADGTYDLAANGVADGDTIDIGTGVTVTLLGNVATTYTNVQIICATDVDLTLCDVKIDNSGNSNVCALSFTGAGNTLTLSGNNVMKSGGFQPGVKVLNGTELSISGSGSLSVTGGQAAPGIGGVATGSGTININGGTITANGGGSAAGIGGGSSVSGGTVNISGGTVTASGSYNGAGIGGGWGGSGGTTTITGGMVTANGGTYGAGIGSGGGQSSLPHGGTTTISGGTVTATGGDYSAGIGGGCWYSNGSYYGGDYSGTVYISGGSVNAIGKPGAKRIGAGYLSSDNGTLKTASGGADVYLTTVTLYNAPANTSVTALSTSSAYGINNMYTGTAGKLYLYLPESTETTSATATAVYSGSIATTADHKADGILIASGDTYMLSAPTSLAWDTTTTVKATWNPAAYASSYSVQLYKDTAAYGSAITGIAGTEYDFSTAITAGGSGSYTFTVTAIGNGTSIADSAESGTSAAYVVLENVTFAASQTGGTSGTVDSTGILLTLSQSVTGLTADKVVITNGTGSVTKGTLSGSGNAWTIALAAVAAQGNVTVSIADFGNFHVTSNPQTVSVYKNTADVTAPTLSSGSVNRTSDTAATIGFTTDEAGMAYYTSVISGAAAPSNADIVNSGTSLGSVSGTVINKAVVLSAGAKDIYVVVMDVENNISVPLKIQAAAYIPTTYTITASATSGGSISPSGATIVAAGGSQTFTITPNSNYSIASVTVDGVNQGAIASYTFSSVADTHTIEAAFNYTGIGGGTISVYHPQTLTHNPTGIAVTGYIQSGAVLTVTDLTLGNSANDTLIRERIRDNRPAFILGMDISISGGYSGSLTISIPVGAEYNGQTVTVLHVKNDGTLNTYSAVVTNGNAVITATSLSPFAVFASSSAGVPNTGEVSFSFGFIALALGLTSLLIWLRRSKAGKRLWF